MDGGGPGSMEIWSTIGPRSPGQGDYPLSKRQNLKLSMTFMSLSGTLEGQVRPYIAHLTPIG